MYKILGKEQFSEKVFKFVVSAPLIARSRRAGNFVILRLEEQGERIPLTIADANTDLGTITLVVQAVGVSTRKLCALESGDSILDVVGPLGRATRIERFEHTVLCAGGGVGVAPLLPIVRALKAMGNRVVTVLAGRTRELIILEKEIRESSDEVIIMTDDGSYGQKGVVTVGMEQVIQREKVDKCFAIGPAIMMKFCCLITAKYGIPTDVSLNTIMVDGTGMCGACRVTVGGERKFVCVDGPEFDGHAVDFDEMLKRMKAFSLEEHEALARFEEAQASLNGSTGHNNHITSPQHATATSCPKTLQPEVNDTMLATADQDTSRDAAWRAELRKAVNPKDRMQTERVEMPHLDGAERAHLFRHEVNLGLNAEQAQREATRCLDCANPGCRQGCPVGIDIPRFIKHIEVGQFAAAATTIKETSSLPAVCGRVCPQEKQCESQCIHLKAGRQPVAIGYLERFAADYAREHPEEMPTTPAPGKSGKRVAVVGSGPAGLSFAGEMAKHGVEVTVFEALHEVGGVLKYGIPEFRLPNSIVEAEIHGLERQGVRFVTDCVIGKTLTVNQLQEEGYDAIFVASGAGLPNFMGIPGENANGILSSNEYLTRCNLMDASNPAADTPVFIGHHVVVVGGGNTAMDSVRTALRLGAETATIVYRRSMEEMPARAEEVHHAKEEGVRFLTLHNPVSYNQDENGHVTQVVLQKMQLGEPDASGRRRPVPVEGALVTLECDLVIVAVGVSPNPIVPASVEGLELGRKHTIVVGDDMQSNITGLYAGGDIVRGGATVILAMGDGKRAAQALAQKFGI